LDSSEVGARQNVATLSRDGHSVLADPRLLDVKHSSKEARFLWSSDAALCVNPCC